MVLLSNSWKEDLLDCIYTTQAPNYCLFIGVSPLLSMANISIEIVLLGNSNQSAVSTGQSSTSGVVLLSNSWKEALLDCICTTQAPNHWFSNGVRPLPSFQ